MRYYRDRRVSLLRPTWRWDFARNGVPGGTTYTGSGGTFVGSNGLIQSATTNVPRFDYDPATLSPLGYLAEMASTNLILRSAAFDNASWTKVAVTATADQVVAPDGATAGDQLTESATTNVHYAYQNFTLTSDTYTGLSCFFKAGTGRDKFYIILQGSANNWATAVFDLATGTVSQTGTGATSGTIASTSIRAFGSGWYRCGMIAKVTVANPYIVIGLAPAASGNSFNTSGEISYAGDGAKFGYWWGAQVDSAGVGVTSYIPTAGSTVTRAKDALSLPLASLPGWSASQGGVLVASYRPHTVVPASPGYNQFSVTIDDGTGNNVVALYAQHSGANLGSYVASGGASQNTLAAWGGSAPLPFVRHKQATGWQINRLRDAYDGSAWGLATGTLALPVAPTTMRFGWFVSDTCLNGTLESIAYYRGARSDAFVQAVSR